MSQGMPAGSITPATRLVVANAIYFKGQWASRFDPGATRRRPFHLSASSSRQVPMMKQQQPFPYAERDGVQLLVLPYVGQSLHMLVLLPPQGGLADLEKQLTAGHLEAWATHVAMCNVDVMLPRFSITSSHSLVKPLQALGLRDAFDAERADFSGMSRRRPLFIHTAEQTCLVEVNEEGTVAAAATHTSHGGCSRPERLPARRFHADRPFLFLIRENSTGTVLFVGRVTNPAS
jgi:serpin B